VVTPGPAVCAGEGSCGLFLFVAEGPEIPEGGKGVIDERMGDSFVSTDYGTVNFYTNVLGEL